MIKNKIEDPKTDPRIRALLDDDSVEQMVRNRKWLRIGFISVLWAGILLLLVDTVGNYLLTISYSVQLGHYQAALREGIQGLDKPTMPDKFSFLTENTLSLYHWMSGLFCLTFILVLSGAKLGDIVMELLQGFKSWKK